MRKLKKLSYLCAIALLGSALGALSAPAEWNQVRQHPVEIGPQADRLIVGFTATSSNRIVKSVKVRASVRTLQVVQAQTSAQDVAALAQRTGLAVSRTRQLTPSMHVMFLPKTLYGVAVSAALARLRADGAVAFAEIDERRYAHATTPNDPLFQPGITSSGQWYMLPPSTLTATSDAAAIDAVSAWDITTGSSGTVIADVDSGFRFDHPDLKRAGFGGRLLPGFDFVGEDITSSGTALNTFLIANDGDGWDPDPSDPGDWIDSTDLMNTALFPSSRCTAENSSWHGTRVAGVLGAITDNNLGVAGMTWNPYILPVRALGKCGGYDSDIMTGMQWAAGLTVAGVPDNPYPADIINLSLGGSGACPSDYQSVINTLTSMGVLIVASAGNESGPVDIPGNCQNVLAVAGLRNVGTKVGYSSLGPEVGISAPAGNCVNSSGNCLRSIDTTVNEGATTPGANSYTDQLNPNLGTSFSAPIVSGVAALMRAVNGNLTPPQLIARIKASASPFTAPAGIPMCPTTTSAGECACVSGQCGAGMLNAFNAVKAALRPIAAVAIPAGLAPGTANFDGSGSVAACIQGVAGSIATYAWTASGGVSISGAANQSHATVVWNGSAGTLLLTVTDSAGSTDTATVSFTTGGATTSAPKSAGSSATACPAPLNFVPIAPTVTPSFSPASVATNADATLTLTLRNDNPFVLTQSSLTQSLPSGLTVDTTAAATTSCTGSHHSVSSTASAVTLGNANIPAQQSCSIAVKVKSTAAAAYTVNAAANVLSTGPAGGNTAAASATLTVTTPVSSSSSSGTGGGGGGEMDIFDILLVAGVFLMARGKLRRRI